MNILKELWDRFLLYLPLALMALLALGTYWLVRSAPQSEGLAVNKEPGHTPDYYMHGFSVRTFDAMGRIRTEVVGDVARHYPDTRLLEIDAIRVRSFDTQGHLTTASARQGITNEDSSELQLIGNAVVVREAQAGTDGKTTPRTEYRGEFLHAFLHTEQIKSHKPVELLRGSDRFTADALDFDNVEQILQLRGRVRGTLVPATP